MKLEIRNQEPNTLAIPKWKLSEPDLRRRVGEADRFGKNGVYLTGDRKYAERRTTLETDIFAKQDSSFIAKYDEIVDIIDERFNPYYLVDTDNSRRIEFELLKINPSDVKGMEKRHTPIRLDILLPETAWEDLTETTEISPSAGTASGEMLTVNNTGQIETYPVITITPTANNSAFTLFNNTTEDLITIGSNSFVPGTTLEIDAINGNLFLDNGVSKIEISSAIVDGTGFFSLARGQNIIQYDSNFGAVNITIAWRNRFLY